MEKQVFRLEEISTPSCFTYPFIPQGFRTARQSRFIARREGIEASISRLSVGNEKIRRETFFHGNGKSRTGSYWLGMLLFSERPYFFSQVAQKGELAGIIYLLLNA